jgi:hypothetical protein
MQKFEEGMRLISKVRNCGLFTSRIMAAQRIGLPSSLDRTIEEGVSEIDRKNVERLLKK